jgi:hypothetical protein
MLIRSKFYELNVIKAHRLGKNIISALCPKIHKDRKLLELEVLLLLNGEFVG